jgi:hypothetical protein
MKDKLIDDIVNQKNILTKNLTENEKKEVDIYLEEILKELTPAIKILDHLYFDEMKRKNITNAFKTQIEEQRWLEKLSKTFYDQIPMEDLTKIQKE